MRHKDRWKKRDYAEREKKFLSACNSNGKEMKSQQQQLVVMLALSPLSARRHPQICASTYRAAKCTDLSIT